MWTHAEADNAFVVKLNKSGNSLVYSTLLGGAGQSFAFDIKTDLLGHAYVTGTTFAADFPATPGAAQSTKTDLFFDDAFVLKLADDGASLEWSTFLGGNGPEP